MEFGRQDDSQKSLADEAIEIAIEIYFDESFTLLYNQKSSNDFPERRFVLLCGIAKRKN